MNFSDDDLKLHINSIAFKAYLEDSDITYETKEQQLPFVPTTYTNDSMAIRVTQKAKFTFNVFSETRFECVNNYRNLQNLLKTIKPRYTYINDQLVPHFENVTGLIEIGFKGLPDGRENITLHLTSFSYTMNKDLGYLHVPRSEILNPDAPNFYEKDNMYLMPIGYKISMEGKVLLDLRETANIFGDLTQDKVLSDEEFIRLTTEKTAAKRRREYENSPAGKLEKKINTKKEGLLTVRRDLLSKGIITNEGSPARALNKEERVLYDAFASGNQELTNLELELSRLKQQ